ncbi:MAG: nicotinate (nicotinamide) nucleotide adenylyltransferase [Bacteroidaceae bacterium]
MPKPVRTALLGGTFNPLHNGHLAIAKSVLEQNLADEVWLLVTPCNPWKVNQEMIDDRVRYQMAAQAVKNIKGIKASDYEFSLPQPSYTANTLRHLSADYPDRQFILTIGADNWVKFNEWKDNQFIRANYPIIVYPRKDCNINESTDGAALLNCPLIDISSTDIRNLVNKGKSIKDLVPESVARFIARKGLYTR